MNYQNKDHLVGAIIVAGWDKHGGGQAFGCPISGTLVKEKWAIDGSGSTYIWAYCDSAFRSVRVAIHGAIPCTATPCRCCLLLQPQPLSQALPGMPPVLPQSLTYQTLVRCLHAMPLCLQGSLPHVRDQLVV